MTENECRCRLREASTGHLTLPNGRRSDAIRVSYVAEDDRLLVALNEALTRTALVDTGVVDLDIDESAASRWKIHVRGRCECDRIPAPTETRTNRAIVVQIEAMRGWHLETESV